MSQRSCVFAVSATAETEVSGCKQHQLEWYNRPQGPMCPWCQELERGRPGCQQLGWDHSLEDPCAWVPVNLGTWLSETKCQTLASDQRLEGCGSVVPSNGVSAGM